MALRVNRISRKRWVLRVARRGGRARNTPFSKDLFRDRRRGLPSTLGKLRAFARSPEIFDDEAFLPWISEELALHSLPRKRAQQSLFSIRDLGVTRGLANLDPVLPCGLRQDQALDLMYRDLTPEDYETLSKLDAGVPKRDTAEKNLVDGLPRVEAKTCAAKECGVCLGEMDPNLQVALLPCKHAFHMECISKWLTQCKNACPICSQPIRGPSAERPPLEAVAEEMKKA